MEKQTEGEEKREHVTRAELTEFAIFVKDTLREVRRDIEALRSELREPKAVALYRCSEEGCTYLTDDLEAFVKHIVREEEQKLSLEMPKPKHPTAEDYLACPECFPHFEKAYLDEGWKKPEKEEESII